MSGGRDGGEAPEQRDVRASRGSLEGVARDASTIREVLAACEREGFTSQFGARDGDLECFTCHHRIDPDRTPVEQLWRLEGASDPDDMLAVVALVCPHCGARGTAVLGYGPVASEDDALVMSRVRVAQR